MEQLDGEGTWWERINFVGLGRTWNKRVVQSVQIGRDAMVSSVKWSTMGIPTRMMGVMGLFNSAECVVE